MLPLDQELMYINRILDTQVKIQNQFLAGLVSLGVAGGTLLANYISETYFAEHFDYE